MTVLTFFLQCVVGVVALLVVLGLILGALAAAFAICDVSLQRQAVRFAAEIRSDHRARCETKLGDAAIAWLDAAEAQIRDGRPDPIVEGAFYKLQTAARDLRTARAGR